MGKNLIDLINSRFAANLGLTIAGAIPQSVGYRLTQIVADRVLSRSSQPTAQIVRANQWIVHDQKLSSEELDQVVRETFRSRAKAMFDLFHNMRRMGTMEQMIDFGPNFEAMIERNRSRKEGTIILLTHTSAHELVTIAAGIRGLKGLGLSYPEPGGGYQWHDEMRGRFGLNVVPTTMASLKMATKYLKDGGTVFTGLERPLPESGYRPKFFGRPTSLPVHYVLMAKRAKVPVVIVAIRRMPGGTFLTVWSDFIEMKRFKDRREEIYYNAEHILSYAERFIREAPEQWAMFYPLWPELVNKVP